MAWLAKLLKRFHGLFWVAGYLFAALFLLLCLAAYGIPGTWVQSVLDGVVPAETGRLTVERLSYRLSEGFILKRPLLCEPDGHVLSSAERCAVDLRLLSFAGLADRVEGLSLDALYLDPAFGTVTLEHLSGDAGDSLTAKALTICAEDGYVLARFDQAFAKLREAPSSISPTSWRASPLTRSMSRKSATTPTASSSVSSRPPSSAHPSRTSPKSPCHPSPASPSAS